MLNWFSNLWQPLKHRFFFSLALNGSHKIIGDNKSNKLPIYLFPTWLASNDSDLHSISLYFILVYLLCYFKNLAFNFLQGITDQINFSYTFFPSDSPAMTLTFTPSCCTTGISLLRNSWYSGSTILFSLDKLTHSWRPWFSLSSTGISEWTIPRPAVIHYNERETMAHD